MLYNRADRRHYHSSIESKEIFVNILYRIHWFIPWVILLAGMVAIVRFARGHMLGNIFTRADRRLMAGFTGFLDLQAAVGLVYFLWNGFSGAGFPIYRILHGVVMLFAAAVPHLSARWRKVDEQRRYIDNFYVLLASFLLMLVGISLIPGITTP